MTSQLISVREVFQRRDPERVARELEPALIEAMDRITRDVAERFQPGLWNALPEFVRKRLVQRVQAELPDLITEIMGDVRDHIDRLFDLKTMVVSNLVRDTKLLNRIFSERSEEHTSELQSLMRISY